MRALIVKWTAIIALGVSAVVAANDALTGTPWLVLALRAGLAFGLIVLAGWGVGYVLMRTALRRYYEQERTTQARPRPRSDR